MELNTLKASTKEPRWGPSFGTCLFLRVVVASPYYFVNSGSSVTFPILNHHGDTVVELAHRFASWNPQNGGTMEFEVKGIGCIMRSERRATSVAQWMERHENLHDEST
jgi:hypothetical protein